MPTWASYAAGGIGLVAAYYLAPSAVVSASLYGVIGVYAIAGLVVGALRLEGRARLPWLAFAMGVALLSIGDGYWHVAQLVDRTVPVPSPADAVYLAAYPFLALGLALLVSRASLRRTTFLDAGIVAVAVGAAVWAPLFAATATAPTWA